MCALRRVVGTAVPSLSLYFACFGSIFGGEVNQRLDLYFIDVEGGAATLIVTPAGESVLIDSGYPDNGGRDLNGILNVVRDVAQLDQIDYAAVTHWHRDHYGNHAALAAQIALGHDVPTASARAQAYTWTTLKDGVQLGRGQYHPTRRVRPLS